MSGDTFNLSPPQHIAGNAGAPKLIGALLVNPVDPPLVEVHKEHDVIAED